MLVQGEAGIGKTVFLRRLEHQLWKAYERGFTDFIAFYIRLPDSNNPSRCVEEFLRSKVAKRGTYNSLKEDASLKLIFLLDGYDELSTAQNLYRANGMGEWAGTIKFIMTSKREEERAEKKDPESSLKEEQ